jgi:L,D-transpeptidase ErfK/SrfK
LPSRVLLAAFLISAGTGCAGSPDAASQPVDEAASGPTTASEAGASEGKRPGVTTPDASPRVIGTLGAVTVAAEDTLLDIAYENDLGFVELVAANPGVDPWVPGEGTRVTLPTQHILPDAPGEGIVINLAEMRLYYFPPEGKASGGDGGVRSYPVGIGRTGLSTPTGTTEISAKIPNPNWYPTRRMREEDPSLPTVVGPGPENPLGDYALNLGWPAYLIHGTNKKWGIGRRVSSGCIRLYPAHIADLFDRVRSGMPVRVVDQPIKFAWVGGALYVEAHTSQQQAESLEKTGSFKPDPDLDLDALVAKARGGRDTAIDWPRLREAVAERRGIPIRISRRGES